MPTNPRSTNVPIYDVGLQELHRVSADEAVRKTVDTDFNEARGRDGARLHVTLKALTEADRRNAENTAASIAALEEVVHLVRGLDVSQDKRFEGVIANLELARNNIAAMQTNLTQQMHEARQALWNQSEGTLQSLSSQVQEGTERVAVDVRKLRDEIVSLVDSRMNQADASFAALRGDVEVVKYLVMDLIKDRIGRNEPKSAKY